MAAVVALAGLCACSPQTVEGVATTTETVTGRQGNDGYPLPDNPFTREGTAVSATCAMGARYAAVVLEAWDTATWRSVGDRSFAIPTDAAFSNYPGVEPVNSALVDLCRLGTENPSPYGDAGMETMAPRVRALFDLGFTRMAVVVRDPGGEATHAGFVEHTGEQDDPKGYLSQAPDDDEQNAVMAPDGHGVWFTYTNPSGEHRIGSRATEGDHRLSDEGPAAGHELPLTVWGKPPLAVQADSVRVSPGEDRLIADAPGVFGQVFDLPRSSGPITGGSARDATLLRDCLGVVGWVDASSVLCRTESGSFQRRDAKSGDASGKPIEVVGPDDGTVAEGLLVSADGKRFLTSVHYPNEPYGNPFALPEKPDLRVAPTTPGETMIGITGVVSATTVFVEWR